MLERDLVFEQVTRLASKVKNKSESGKQDTLSLAKKVKMRKTTDLLNLFYIFKRVHLRISIILIIIIILLLF